MADNASTSPLRLSGATSTNWTDATPVGTEPIRVYIGPDPDGLGGFQVAVADVASPPSRQTMLALHAARKGKRGISLVVAATMGDRVWLLGPDEQTAVVDGLSIDQAMRQLQSALDEPDSLAAYSRLGSLRRALDSTSIPGCTNNGLFASYHIRENVPKRADWSAKNESAKSLLGLRHQKLIEGLGFKSKTTVGNALVLTANTESPRAVAVLLDDSEQFDAKSPRFQLSPVAWGLNVAARQGVPWLIVLRKDQIRLYPGRDGVGVGQKGQVETFFEIDLAAIDEAHAALLQLVFSAEALEPDGTAKQLLDESGRYASRLGVRLRERVYEHVVPQISQAIAKQLPTLGLALDDNGLDIAYRLSLRILFRLLFQAYAEDRGLLPAGRNERYDANSLKTIAQRDIDTDPADFSSGAQSLWLDLVQVWNAIDEGNPLWEVPAYNGGLFGSDAEIHPEGNLVSRIALTDDVLGPALQHMLIDVSEDGVRGPVDFRSLSVREFGTIYEGLLESSLSVANVDLTLDANQAWIPARTGDTVEATAGTAYFHSASGERKATGSYFTPAFVVDHLIDGALNPSIDAHLARIKVQITAGDEAAAARDFFDFRVADLAMGSGHFLVAAVDRIESKMRSFLAEPENRVPGVSDELARLADAAKAALGRDETAIGEVEPIALLRRQIARRCIYGLDLNPLAVELSRLALWIHTFVPGLPMSSLDHGLVCANSLTGVGTIDEALDALQPRRAPGDVTFFDGIIEDNLVSSKTLLLDAANASEASKKEVRDGAALAKRAREAAEPARLIFDTAVAARIGAVNPAGVFTTEDLLDLSRSPEVQHATSGLSPAHMPYLFPEVFLRSNPGFDVLIGNPPWEELMVEETKFWLRIQPGLFALTPSELKLRIFELRRDRPDLVSSLEVEVAKVAALRKVLLSGPYPGLGTGDIDLYQAFAWRNLQLLRSGGALGIVFPRSLLNSAGGAEWRAAALKSGTSNVVTLTNSGNWVFEGLDGRYSVALVTVSRETQPAGRISIAGPFSDIRSFSEGRLETGELSFNTVAASSSGAALPQLPSSDSVEVLTRLRTAPRLDATDSAWDFRSVREFDATNDRKYFDAGQGSARWPVLGGKGFNLWTPESGEVYAYADPAIAVRALAEKRKNQVRLRNSAFFNLPAKVSNDESTLPCFRPRIAFRDIARATDSRTVIAGLVPPNVILTNKAPYLYNATGNLREESYLLGVLSSIPLDWYARRYVEIGLSVHILNGLPIPRPALDSPLRLRVIEIAGSLSAIDQRFAEWADSVGVPIGSVTSATQKQQMIAELDALVSLLYGLTEKHVGHIFETFQRGWDNHSRLEMVFSYYASWKERT